MNILNLCYVLRTCQSNIMTDYSIFPLKSKSGKSGKSALKIRIFSETWFSFTLYWFNFRVHLSLSVMSSTKNTIYFALSLCLQQKSIHDLISCVRPLCNEKYEKHNFYRNMLKKELCWCKQDRVTSALEVCPDPQRGSHTIIDFECPLWG